MALVPTTEIYACSDLVGFWQFPAAGGHFFGVLERDPEGKESALAIGRLVGQQAQIIKKITNADVSIKAIDAYPMGDDMVFALEINRGRALQVVRTALATLIDPAVTEVPFNALTDLNLSAEQLAGVNLPVSLRWNVADPLAPMKWLFSPRLIRGGQAEVIANTSDGQASVPGTDAGDAIPDAAMPQAYTRNRQRTTAFLRTSEPYYPFWSLRRYSGDDQPTIGDLMVAADGATKNLSTDLKIGPVIAFALAADRAGVPWLFAVREGPESQVVAMTRREAGWVIAQQWVVEGETNRLSAEHSPDGWRLIFAMKTAQGWSLRAHSWQG